MAACSRASERVYERIEGREGGVSASERERAEEGMRRRRARDGEERRGPRKASIA